MTEFERKTSSEKKRHTETAGPALGRAAKSVPLRVEKYMLSFLDPSSLGVMLVTNQTMRSLVQASLTTRRDIELSDDNGKVSVDERRLWAALAETSSGNLQRLVVHGQPLLELHMYSVQKTHIDWRRANGLLDHLDLLVAVIRAHSSTLESLSLGDSECYFGGEDWDVPLEKVARAIGDCRKLARCQSVRGLFDKVETKESLLLSDAEDRDVPTYLRQNSTYALASVLYVG